MQSLYVCLFSNGHIKVGRTIHFVRRVQEHADRLAPVGTVLTDITRWICEDDGPSRERWLIARCAAAASERFQQEWFAGLDFLVVRTWAGIAAKQDIPAEYRRVVTDVARVHGDWEAVRRFGPAKLARQLGCRIQVVQNWKTRGVPSRIKLKLPGLFS